MLNIGCHLYSVGYDVVNDLDGLLKKIDNIVGLDRVKSVHLNDSKVEFNSNKDRYKIIGKGTIGVQSIVDIINHPLLKDLPFNLETPNELEGHRGEIQLTRKGWKWTL